MTLPKDIFDVHAASTKSIQASGQVSKVMRHPRATKVARDAQ